MQALGEIVSVLLCQCAGRHKADTAIAEVMVEALDTHIGGNGAIGNHQIQTVQGEFGK